ncbi:CG32069 [Drosophila busckii]|uniref:Immediate early response 3-interacting protein 1 n=1 Tax=Drosophila busckii TaxID=30019 RepID=A0A0M5J3W7_DROBS|nr:immediate early response 3-interacting protein 1 [Drosophila busckii]ALC44281.1 CG32069 [Drosophila busckii]
MFTLWTLVEASLLCLNAVCILHEERFLAKFGWGRQANQQNFGPPTAKDQVLNLIRSIRTVAKIPLIFLNVIAIIFKLLLG